MDTVWPHLEDEAGLLAEAKQGRAMGFQGKMSIHPKQLEIINRTYSPTPEELAFARKVSDAFEAAKKAGSWPWSSTACLLTTRSSIAPGPCCGTRSKQPPPPNTLAPRGRFSY